MNGVVRGEEDTKPSSGHFSHHKFSQISPINRVININEIQISKINRNLKINNPLNMQKMKKKFKIQNT